MDRRNSKPKAKPTTPLRLDISKTKTPRTKSLSTPSFLGNLRITPDNYTCIVCGTPIPPGKSNRFCITCRWKPQEVEPDEADTCNCIICGTTIPGKSDHTCDTCQWNAQEIEPDDTYE